MADQPTCGQGLAEHSVLPTRVAELIDAMAANLEVHIRALDLTDEKSEKERDAYVRLAESHRRIAAELRATGREMAGYRDLPMGRHDQKEMSSRHVVDAFERFVQAERELLALLQERVQPDQEMLDAIGRAAVGEDS